MTRQFIAFIRHGDYHQLANTPSAHQPFALTTLGQTQARQAAKRIESFCLEQQCELDAEIASSHLLRAWQTASIISQELIPSTHIVSTMALAERSVGTVANLTIDEIEKIIADDPRYDSPPKNWKSNSEYKLPFHGAESLFESGQRVADYISNVMTMDQSQNHSRLKLFVGHGAAFRHAAYALNILKREQIKQLSMYHAHPIFFEQNDLHEHWQHIAGDWKQRQLTDKPD